MGKVNALDWLYRRAFTKPEKNYLNPDGTATSRVFKLREKDEGSLSVEVKSMTLPSIAVQDPARFMLFEIANSEVIALGLDTYHDPLPDGSNDAHALIVGMSLEDEILPGLLARKSRRVEI